MLNQQGPLMEEHFSERTSEPAWTPPTEQARLADPQSTSAMAEGITRDCSLCSPAFRPGRGQQRTREKAVSSLCPHMPSPAPSARGGHSVCVPSQQPEPAALVSPFHSSDPMLSHLGTLLASPFFSPLPISFFSWRNCLNLALSWKKTSPLPYLKPLPLMPCLTPSCQRSKSGAHCRPGHPWPLCLT